MTIRVLLADDQALVRGALAALLGLEPDIEVVAEVGRGDEVVEAVERTRPDVCLLDIEMPGGNGIDVAAELAGGSPPVPGADRDDVQPAGLPAARARGRRQRLRRQGHPGAASSPTPYAACTPGCA